jgi:PAS domain S-box-containing protein
MAHLGMTYFENRNSLLSDEVGKDFFQKLVEYVAETLGADIALVGYLDEKSKDKIQTLSVIIDSKPAENFEYELVGTPCEKVIEGTPCFIGEQVSQIYANDKVLTKNRIESYVGIPLVDGNNNAIGILLALSRSVITDEEFALTIINFFADRAGGELRRRLYEIALENKVSERTRELTEEILKRKEATERLAETLDRFRDLAIIASDWLWETDEELKFTYLSERAYEVYGWKPGIGIGLSRIDLLDQGYWEVDPKMLARQEASMKSQEIFRKCESLVTIPGRGQYYISTSGTPFFDDQGNFKGYRGSCTDISGRKKSEIALQRSEERISKLYNETPIMMHSIDRNGIIEDVNDFWLSSLGFERSEIVGKSGLAHLTDESRKRALEVNLPIFF